MTQDGTVAALGDPAFYPHRVERVEHIQTHISHVFLAGAYAYKLKKAVRFPFLDFGTVERRRHFCAEELRLNRRLCPAVYLDVVPITRAARGELRLGGDGDAVDHVLRMRRLPPDRMLPSLLDAGTVRDHDVEQVARTVAAFHAAAPTGAAVAGHADPDVLRRRWDDETAATAPFAGRLLAVEDHEVLADFGPWFITTHETLLRARQQAGRIREGHGDLHAANVCLLDRPLPAVDGLSPLAAGVYVFDCIEFSYAFRCNDVASEVAFLAMDLDARGRADLARRFVDAYIAATDDRTVPLLLPFYACHRARVRGKVEGLTSAEREVDAADRATAETRSRRHFALAVRYAWQSAGPAVIACCGLSGSGKSALAAAVAGATGFAVVGSDVIRKRDGGAGPARYGAGLYTPAAREATYDALSAEASRILAAGRGVVADATFLRAADRRRLADVARAERRPILFVECRADEDVIRARLDAREHEPSLSDARWETYLGQRAEREPFTDEEAHVVVDTTGDVAAARTSALRAVWQWRRHAT